MKTLSEHEDFYARICHVSEKLLDKIEAKVDSGEPIPVDVAACLAKATSNMIKAVASKGGTTEKALEVLDNYDFEKIITEAMIACTNRADELGKIK